jgi:hypothetical protein
MPNGFDNPYQTEIDVDPGWGTLPFETSSGTFGTNYFMNPAMADALGIPPGIDWTDQYEAFTQDFPEFFTDYFEQYGGEWGGPIEGAIQYQGINPEIMSALGNIFTVPAQEEGSNMSSWYYDAFGPEGYGWDFQGLTETGWDEENYTEFPWESALEEEGFIPGLMDEISDEQWEQWGIPGFQGQEQILTALDYMDVQYPEFMYDAPSYLYGTNIFDPGSIASTLSDIAGFDDPDSAIRAGEIKALTPGMIEKTESQYYEPYEAAERKKLIGGLSKNIGKINPGGFAGSGIYSGKMSGAEKGYRKGYEGLLGDIMDFRGSATGDVLDTIYGWQEFLDE